LAAIIRENVMPENTCDLIVIGAGPAGQSAAEFAAWIGRKAIIIERDKPGGVVTTTGGAPTKTLREAALYLTGFRQGQVYGVERGVPLEVARPIIRALPHADELGRDVADGMDAQELAIDGFNQLKKRADGRERSTREPTSNSLAAVG